MNTFEALASERLVLRHESNFASVAIRNNKRRLWLVFFVASAIALVGLAWGLWQNSNPIGSSVIFLFSVGLVFSLFGAIFFWQKFQTDMKNAKKIVVTNDLITIESLGIFRSRHQTLASAAIESVKVVPDAFSRPFRKYPYRRRNHHLCLQHAGEDIHIFSGLSHMEAKAIAATILPGTNCLQLDVYATTPGVPRHPNVVQLHEQDAPPATPANNAHVSVSRNDEMTNIKLRPHLVWSHVMSFVLVAFWGIASFDRFAKAAPDAEQMLLNAIMLGISVLLLGRIFFNMSRKETVSISAEFVDHRISSPFREQCFRYRTADIGRFEITDTYDKVFVDSDFERKTIFKVCFDYGQTARTIGFGMPYSEANYICDIMSNDLKERRRAA